MTDRTGKCQDCGAEVVENEGVLPMFCPGGRNGAGNCAAYCSHPTCMRVPCSDAWHAAQEHTADEDCTVGPEGFCIGCGVDHSGTCVACGGRGYHRAFCPDLGPDRIDPYDIPIVNDEVPF